MTERRDVMENTEKTLHKCSICGEEECLVEFGDGYICPDCISLIKATQIKDFEF